MSKKEKELTRNQKVENYFNMWGGNKRSLVGIVRQLIFLIGFITTLLVGAWVLMNSLITYFNNDTYRKITNNLAIISIVFIGCTWALDSIYLVTEWVTFNKTKLNRLASLLVGSVIVLLLTVFVALTCVEIYGPFLANRDYIYCIYLVICFSCCLYSTIYCFGLSKRGQKFNPSAKLLKSLSYTIGLLAIMAIVIYILWIMWYSGADSKLTYTCFILARTFLTLVGSIIVKVVAQIIFVVAINNPSKHKYTRLIYLSIIFAVLFSLEMWCGSLFLKNGPWLTATIRCKAAMTILALATLTIGNIDIGLAGRYATHLEKR